MNLKDFPNYIHSTILDRGEDYASDGRVLSLKRLDDREYAATVEGTDYYYVRVELDEDGNILDSGCDCPFDGPICKHQVAVFYVLRDEMARNGTTEEETAPVAADPSLRELLEAESKESLISLLLSIASDDGAAEQRIRLFLSKDGDKEIADCRRLIQTYIYRHADRHGFVSWRSVDKAVEGAEIVAGKAAEAFGEEEWLRGVNLHLCVVREMALLLQSADDSDGVIGGMIEGSLEEIGATVQDLRQIPDAERVEIFRRLLDESQHPCYEGWSDWQLSLLESANALIASDEMQAAWDEAAEAIADSEEGSEWSREYIDQRVSVLRYEQILRRSGEEEARRFLEQQLHVPDLRERAIRSALAQGDAEQAIRLAEDGEAADAERGLPGLVAKWKKLRFEAYRIAGRVESLRSLGRELITDGEYEIYRTVKETFSENDPAWSSYLHDVLDRLPQTFRGEELYTRILVEERMFARLLEYVREYPYRIESFWEVLLPHDPDAVKAVFLEYIELRADRANNRREYAHLARIIRMLKKAGGKDEARDAVERLLQKFPRRPAMREELEAIRL